MFFLLFSYQSLPVSKKSVKQLIKLEGPYIVHCDTLYTLWICVNLTSDRLCRWECWPVPITMNDHDHRQTSNSAVVALGLSLSISCTPPPETKIKSEAPNIIIPSNLWLLRSSVRSEKTPACSPRAFTSERGLAYKAVTTITEPIKREHAETVTAGGRLSQWNRSMLKLSTWPDLHAKTDMAHPMRMLHAETTTYMLKLT